MKSLYTLGFEPRIVIFILAFGNPFLFTAQETKGLKDHYAEYFAIGVAVSPRVLSGYTGELIKRQFNSITPENVMKMGAIHPEDNQYN